MKMMKKFPISFWNAMGFNKDSKEKVDDWNDLGITLAMMPCDLENKQQVHDALDRAQEHDMKVFLCDPRADWHIISREGEERYREGMAEAIADFGNHPAMFGFFVGDEPDAPDAEAAFAAIRINNEMAPHLIGYLNLLPWFDWIGPRIGSEAYGPYLDRVVKEGNSKLISYDCYAQMWPEKRGYDVYFNNLREHYLASKRNDVPFFNIVLSSGHYDYRCPSRDDMLWQLTSSVAHGASGVTWFLIEMPELWENYRDLPFNMLGDRTEQFGWLREVNCTFNNYVGEVMATLKIDQCYHVKEAYGGMPLFEAFDNIVDVNSSATPLVISSFYNEAGERFYVVCNNSPEESTNVSMKIKGDITLTRCMYGNTFKPIHTANDAVAATMHVPDQSFSIWLAPGQMALLKEENK